MADANPGIVFPINEAVSTTNRIIPGGVIGPHQFVATKDAAGNVWLNLAVQLTGAQLYPAAFPAVASNKIGYFPFSNPAKGELGLDGLNFKLTQSGSKLQVTAMFEVEDGKIGGAGTVL